ncbi:MAG: hypothetical protein Kow0098_26240 [Ignavibacteriaceae bacterium]
MSIRITLFRLLITIPVFCHPLFAQEDYYTAEVQDTIPINFDNKYSISSVNIIPFSEKIILRGKELSRSDYNISYASGIFSLSDSLAYSIFDTLFVSYQTIRLSLQKEYKHRSLLVKYDENVGDTIKVVQYEGEFSSEEIFGRGIQKSGTIIRGFTVGTNKDFSLNSGLRLQISGNLSDDIEIVAALTDENTPIQPEGNTERLEELDKVYIQIRHPNAIGNFGDYDLNKRYGEFGIVNRKLQGLMGEFFYSGQTGYVAIAGSKGKFNSNFFNGIDGVQGPYRLTGINGENDIIIIAGSEKVFLDGIEMTRGENNDFIIDYSNASVTFTPKRLITSASRINIDFEYTDRRYSRNFFGAGVESSLFNNTIGIKVQYLREGDDKNSPIDLVLSEDDKKILEQAGDDRNKAVKSGVSLAAPDSLGIIRGTYIEKDTVINNQSFKYYIYSPGDSLAKYNVSFSYVGEGKGDYIRESLGVYRFTGIGTGNYLPVIFLPLAELKQVGNIVLDLNLVKDVSLILEYSGSLWDKNQFSGLDKADDYGYARNILLNVSPQKIDIADISLGKIGLSYKDRFVQSRFTSPDRFNSVEFNRDYNIGELPFNEDESLREIGLSLTPVDELTINSTAGFLRKGDSFKSDRYNNILRFSDNDIYNLNYKFDYVKTENQLISSSWLRENGSAGYKVFFLKPGIDYISEKRKDKQTGKDSLITGSLEYLELGPFIELIDVEGFEASAKYSWREESFPLNGFLTRQSSANTHYYRLNYFGIDEVNSSVDFTYRVKKYTEQFKSSGLLDNETILIRSQNRFNFWQRLINGDLFYEVSTQKSARLEKVFVKVEQGTGNYRYIGDLNNDGIADENEFEPTLYDGDFILVTLPTDELFPVIDLKSSTRWKLNYKELFTGKSFFSNLISPVSTETYWRVEENTREEDYKKIYLLQFSYFQNEQNTIAGTNYFQQDIFLFENDTDFSTRLRFAQRKSLNQFSGGVERSYFRERSLRINFKLIQEVGNQTDIAFINDNVRAPESSNRKRQVDESSVTTDFSYRPERNIEIGFKIKVSRSEDRFPLIPTVIDLNSLLLRFNLSFAGTGRLRIEIQRDELNASTTENFIPFELTGGNLIGKNYIWRVNFDYRLSSNLQSTLSYDGRVQGGGKTVHTMRAEARAYF